MSRESGRGVERRRLVSDGRVQIGSRDRVAAVAKSECGADEHVAHDGQSGGGVRVADGTDTYTHEHGQCTGEDTAVHNSVGRCPCQSGLKRDGDHFVVG